MRELDRLAIYGRLGGLAIYELVDFAEEGKVRPSWVALYESGLAAYRARDFLGAIAFFRQLLAVRESDQPARVMLERCSELLKSPPRTDWEGTHTMKVK